MGKIYFENVEIDQVTSDGIRIDAADKQKRELSLKVEFRNFTASNTKNGYSSFIKVLENSEL